MHLGKELLKINHALSEKGVKLRIEQRGGKLNLRGPLPCRLNKGITRIQRLSLGLPSSQEGLHDATKKLQLILLQIDHNQFEWKHWSTQIGKKEHKKNTTKAFEAIKSFESSLCDSET